MTTASIALAGALLLSLWLAAGFGAVLYVVVFGLAIIPGLPLGLTLFGARHPAGWIGGTLLGYGLTQLMLWAIIDVGAASPTAFVLGWVLLGGLTTLISRIPKRPPLIEAPSWTSADLRMLLLVLCLVPLLMAATYRNLGRTDDVGNRYYRAYFTADFLWHAALAHELGKFSLPPRNPYLAPEPMNYYWTYFLLPATTAQLAPAALADVERTLEANAMLVGLLMMGALFVFVRSGVASSRPAALAVVLALLAASAEGLYAIVDLLRSGRPLAVLLDTNIDAITAWEFGGLRVDNMPRSLWYTPQHTTSIALGLTALTVAVLGGAASGLGAALTAGLALGLSTMVNPLIGAACSLLYGATILIDAVRRPGAMRAIGRHALAAVFVAAAVGWAAASRVTDGAASAVDIGFSGFSRRSPLLTLLLSLGPVLVPAAAGLFGARTDQARRAVAVAASGILTGLFLLYFVRVSEASWVGFRAGQILLVTIPVLLARTFEKLRGASLYALAGVILVVGLPTTVIDAWNAQDIWNRRPGPGFRWTLWTTPDQQQAFAWIQQHTEPTAIVQMEPMVRGREHWTLIPSFAGRRMAAGLPISLLPVPEYQQRSEIVKRIFETPDPNEAHTLARRMGIDFLYVDSEDLSAYPVGAAKFDANPAHFRPVFRNATVRVYRVE